MLLTPILLWLAVKFANNTSVFRLAVPVAFRSSGVKVMGAEEDNLNKVITTTNGRINISFDPSWQNKTMAMLCFAAAFAGAVIAIYQVRKILKSLQRNEPFDRLNFYRVRIIGFLLITYFVGKVIFVFLVEKIVLSSVNFQHVKLAYFSDIVILWAGLIMLVLEALFKRGADLEEEEKLTI